MSWKIKRNLKNKRIRLNRIEGMVIKLVGIRPSREAPVPFNRMEPNGPNRYLKTDHDIREYLKKDRKIVSTLIVDCALSVLKRDFAFSDEELNTFHAGLQEEILAR